jgi:hypothetical protein
VADVFIDLENLAYVNRVRYDSPRYHGFQLSGSAGENQRRDATLRWNDEIGDFQFAGASSYSKNAYGLVDWRGDAALSTLHKPSGVNLTVGGSVSEPKRGEKNWSAYIVKGGWRTDWFDFGETCMSADFSRNFDVSSEDEDGTSIGAFIVQNVDDWLLQFYTGYRYYNLDRDELDTKPIHVPTLGTRKWF